MEDEKLPPYVQYHASDASVTFADGESTSLKTPPKRGWKSRCTAMGLLKVAVAVLLITTVVFLSLFFLQRGQPTPNAEYLKFTALPEVANFTLVAADNHYITLAWDQPRRSIDYYLLDVTGGTGYENDSLQKQRAGTCSNGTFIRAEQTQVTCGPFDACSNLSVTIRTHTTGPPERTSMGTTFKELLIRAQEPSEPKSITMVAKSPSMTRLLWEPPKRIHGLVDVYTVKVCETFSECDQKQNMSDCIEHEVSDTWLDFDSKEDTPYCVLMYS
ncbi:uncharacterized protein LOC119463482 [Dermacentor silvarum]|uniref:uncharacterized protein LOC119463482 n=1 Tax=Dermacentor silvarum TaxID=543639 RepID=UPI0021011CAB|nr:uncharacterized protein LOC119463482 [Dermacentor silvarum]XP_049512621.1 uncharacterized protein LOC119463482 [Dermacentor silvarum]